MSPARSIRAKWSGAAGETAHPGAAAATGTTPKARRPRAFTRPRDWTRISRPVDTATFDNSTGTGGTVNLNNASPSLSGINFSGTNGYTLAQGSGTGTVTLNNGGGVATISVTGNHTISAPITLSSNASVSTSGSSDMLTISGAIGGSGGLAMNGAGMLVVSGPNTYSGPTSVNTGTLQLGSSSALPPGAVVTVNGLLDLNAFNASVTSLYGTGTIDTVAGGTPTLTVLGGGDFEGVLQNSNPHGAGWPWRWPARAR